MRRQEIAIEEYQGLYDLIGTTYGSGDSAFWAQVFYPATTFNIPDLRGRTIIGVDDFNSEDYGALQEHSAVLGATGGEEYHLLSESELPEHEHDIQFYRRPNGNIGGFQNPWHEVQSYANSNVGPTWTNNSVIRANGGGGNMPHNNMQPYMALNYIMKVKDSQDNEPFQMYFSGSVGDEGNEQELSQHRNIVIVEGNSHAENGCSGCSYHYTLNLSECQCPVGESTRILNNLGYTNNSPSLRVSYADNIIANWHGPSFIDFVWTGSAWMISE